MKKLKIVLVLSTILLLFMILNKTYAIFYSETKIALQSSLAGFNIIINDLEAKNSTFFSFDDITWINPHANSNKIAPGSIGTIDLVINAENVDVAFDFEINFIDHLVDSSKLLTLVSVKIDNQVVTPIDNKIVIPFGLNDLSKVITLDLEWVNDEENNEYDSMVGQGLEAESIGIIYKASQIIGEENA